VSLVFLDDAVAADFQPFALTRPCCELRVGALLVRQRWEMATGMGTHGFIGAPHLTHFNEPGAASFLSDTIPAGSILVNARCAVALKALDAQAEAWSCEGRLAAVRLRSAMSVSAASRDGALESLASSGNPVAIEGRWLDKVWDIVRLLPELLAADVPLLGERIERAAVSEVTTLGSHAVYVERGATIEPMVLFDATAGPILVRRGATIHAFTRLVGPCVIGEGSIVNGGRVASSSIGEHCRVHGEVSVSIFTGHANKGHEGFIGHSVLGRWVNLGAGTTNSNLKNNYSDVVLWTPRGLERTGMQFLGSFLGDHAKTAILTRLTTGAVIGAGANVYGSGMSPRYVPPFAWGLDGSDVWELGAFLDTAERAMKRRDVPLTESARQQLTAAWEREVGDKR
jgi:UDP-N-acetylglucosamine diphosphorylase / glucose-1-phosphate thymidylyltransferase / UDP-N-acetylgalactosamine diphosphorylase / glucosamine-1-phosphate N-acetyltransferase / galactosamine-1-phosphate N-acetyltransferase